MLSSVFIHKKHSWSLILEYRVGLAYLGTSEHLHRLQKSMDSSFKTFYPLGIMDSLGPFNSFLIIPRLGKQCIDIPYVNSYPRTTFRDPCNKDYKQTTR